MTTNNNNMEEEKQIFNYGEYYYDMDNKKITKDDLSAEGTTKLIEHYLDKIETCKDDKHKVGVYTTYIKNLRAHQYKLFLQMKPEEREDLIKEATTKLGLSDSEKVIKAMEELKEQVEKEEESVIKQEDILVNREDKETIMDEYIEPVMISSDEEKDGTVNKKNNDSQYNID